MSLCHFLRRLFRRPRPRYSPPRIAPHPRHRLEAFLRLAGWRPGWSSVAARLVAVEWASESSCHACGTPGRRAVSYTHDTVSGCRVYAVCRACAADEELRPGLPEGPP